MRLALFAIIAVSIATLQAKAEQVKGGGPFGVKMGSKIEDHRSCKPEGNEGSYHCETVPSPHPDFEFYVIQAHKSTGVCSVTAVGKEIHTDGYGTDLKSKIDEIRFQIEIFYKWSEDVDVLSPGSIWNRPEDWMMSVAQKDRIYGAEWGGGKKKLKNDLSKIFLSSRASNSSIGHIAVEFRFNNYDACEENNRSEKDRT